MKRKTFCFILLLIILFSNILVYAEDNNPSINEKTKTPVVANNLPFVKINDTVEIDSDITMMLILDNIEYDNFTFKLYSSSSLSNIDTKDINLTNLNNEEITFDYCINCSSLKTITLNYKLPANINVGDKITFNINLINKDNIEETMNTRVVVSIIESLKKEETAEIQDKDKIDKEKSNISSRSITNFSGSSFSNITSSTSSKSNVSTTYKGSSNNYLSNITIKGYELNKTFSKERLTYFVTVPNSVKSLNISTAKESSKATIAISGNNSFEVGLNKLLIIVTSEDGRVKTYRIYVTRLDSDKNEG